MGDKGFNGVPMFVMPHKKARGAVAVPPLVAQWNTRVNRLRWRVEDAFLHTKKFWIFKQSKRQGHAYDHNVISGMWCVSALLYSK
eukprot:gene16603-482_t